MYKKVTFGSHRHTFEQVPTLGDAKEFWHIERSATDKRCFLKWSDCQLQWFLVCEPSKRSCWPGLPGSTLPYHIILHQCHTKAEHTLPKATAPILWDNKTKLYMTCYFIPYLGIISKTNITVYHPTSGPTLEVPSPPSQHWSIVQIQSSRDTSGPQ